LNDQNPIVRPKEAAVASPTISDVARVAQVSRQTVSNVLNSPEIVKPETRARVQSAIQRLAYRRHASARRLRTQSSSTIGIRLDALSNGISGSVLDRYLHALTERAAAWDLRILLFTARDTDDEIDIYQRLHDGADIDAVIVTSTNFSDPRVDWLRRQQVPFVAFGRPWGESLDRHRWVDVDGYAGTREATEHLAQRGLRHVAFLGWPAGSGSGDERRRGWADAMRHLYGSGDTELAERAFDTVEDTKEARRVIEGILRCETDIQAFVCVSDSVALGAMMAVTEAGLRSLPVIGFDNTPVAQAVGLSSVEQNLEQVAEATLELLLGGGNRVLSTADLPKDQPLHQLIVPRLVVRGSSYLTPVDDSGETKPDLPTEREHS
jgi:DNA-binding LacI/PurR family transcriptional regulator